MGLLIEARKIAPDVILCSSALRARSTAALVVEAGSLTAGLFTREDLYLAGPGVYIDLLAELPEEHESAMVVGHNPGLEKLVERLTGDYHRLTTAALAHIHLPISEWGELAGLPIAELADLWRPRELAE